MLRDFLTTCAILALRGQFLDLHRFIAVVFDMMNPGPAVRVVLSHGSVTTQSPKGA